MASSSSDVTTSTASASATDSSVSPPASRKSDLSSIDDNDSAAGDNDRPVSPVEQIARSPGNWLTRTASKVNLGRNRTTSIGASGAPAGRRRPQSAGGPYAPPRFGHSEAPPPLPDLPNRRLSQGSRDALPTHGEVSSLMFASGEETLVALPEGTDTPPAGRTPRSSLLSSMPPLSAPTLPLSMSTGDLTRVNHTEDVNPRRKSFGRSASARVSTSSTADGEDRSGRGAKDIVKRMSSRTFFRNKGRSRGKDSDSLGAPGDPSRSTDTLSSVGTHSDIADSPTSSGSTALGNKRLGEGPIGRWVQRRKGSKTSSHSSRGDGSEAEQRPRESFDSNTGSFASEAYPAPSLRNGVHSHTISAGSNRNSIVTDADGRPKRLSGWLMNMLANGGGPQDGSQGAGDSQPSVEPSGTLTRARSQSSVAIGVRPSGTTPANSPIREGGVLASMLPSFGGSSGAGGLASSSTNAAARSRTSLLSNLGATAKAKALGVASGAGIAGGGGLGFDRAFRYFLDSNETSADADALQDGIWLLGVWHGQPEAEAGGKDDKEAASPNTQSASTPASAPGSGNASTASSPPSTRVPLQTPAPRDRGAPPSAYPQSMNPAIEVQGASPSPRRKHGRSGSTSSLSGGWVDGSSEDAFQGRSSPPRTPSPGVSPSASAVNVSARVSSTPQGSPNPAALSSMAPARKESLSSTIGSGSWQPTFQPDFSSRIWCTYRNSFAPIARDGTISEQAESAAAEAAALLALTPSAAVAGAPSPVAGGPRTWLGRKVGESPSLVDLAQSQSTSPTTSYKATSPQASSPRVPAGALGPAFGVSSPTSLPSSPNASSPASTSLASATALSLSDKMGIPNLWGRATGLAQAAGFGRAGLTTDAGWGCMLRTGQSLLANALLDVHLGRDWRRGVPSLEPMPDASSAETDASLSAWREARARHAKYVRLISWFLDDPSPACPFSVHRMAREGKRLGKEVGEWFGPSTAAGAIKRLVDEYPQAGLGVTIASDGVVYRSHVRKAAALPGSGTDAGWARPTLVLVGVRLGLEGVNPMYHDSIKALFTFPHSVGIAGGRPSSSYYFMGFQGHSLFYLDPHQSRPAVPFRHPPTSFPPAPDAVNAETGDAENEGAHAEPASSESEALAFDHWWASAYSDAQLSTFHCDRVRRMPIKGLDPSMLLGFLCIDEASFEDLAERVKALPKAIFSIADAPPKWVLAMEEGSADEDGEDDGEDAALESFSESGASEELDGERVGSQDEEEDLDLDPEWEDDGGIEERRRRREAREESPAISFPSSSDSADEDEGPGWGSGGAGGVAIPHRADKDRHWYAPAYEAASGTTPSSPYALINKPAADRKRDIHPDVPVPTQPAFVFGSGAEPPTTPSHRHVSGASTYRAGGRSASASPVQAIQTLDAEEDGVGEEQALGGSGEGENTSTSWEAVELGAGERGNATHKQQQQQQQQQQQT